MTRSKLHSLTIGPHHYEVNIARDTPSRISGLRGPLQGSVALLLRFPFPFRWGIWMRGIHHAIDIVWIIEQRVVGITHRPRPSSWYDRFHISFPPQLVDTVLEIPGSPSQRLGDCLLRDVVEQWLREEKFSAKKEKANTCPQLADMLASPGSSDDFR